MKGMVLAAGYGTRLRPLSGILPKPMFPAANMPLIDFALHRLSSIGIDEAAVNLHHLPDPIKEHLKQGGRFGQKITFSEEPRILGTGGGIKAVREWIGRERFAVTNGDTLLLTSLEQVLEAHEKNDAMATIALIRETHEGRFSSVAVDESNYVMDVGGRLEREDYAEHGVFAGFHVIDPEIFDFMPDRDHFCIIQDVYLPLIEKMPGSIAACFVEGAFFDMGTPADYLEGNISLLTDHINPSSLLVSGMRHLGENVFIGENVRLGKGVNLLGPCIIGNDVMIEGGSEVGPAVAVGHGARLGAWTRLRGSVVWPGAMIPTGRQHSHCIFYGREYLEVQPLPE